MIFKDGMRFCVSHWSLPMLYAIYMWFTSECQGMPVVLQEPAEVPMTVERGPQSRPLPSVDEPAPEREKEAERPDSETESDVDDP